MASRAGTSDRPYPAGERSPSRPLRRAPVAVLALLGCAISVYLALFQYHVLDSVWDPFFGDGSAKVLTSPLSRALPISDAALGAIAYLVEAGLDIAGGRDRWRTRPWLVLLLGAAAAAFAVVGLSLVISQPLLTGTFCTLCLASAVISWIIAALVAEEVLAAARYARAARAHRRRNRLTPREATRRSPRPSGPAHRR